MFWMNALPNRLTDPRTEPIIEMRQWDLTNRKQKFSFVIGDWLAFLSLKICHYRKSSFWERKLILFKRNTTFILNCDWSICENLRFSLEEERTGCKRCDGVPKNTRSDDLYECVTRPTNQPTDRPTDTASYRDALSHLTVTRSDTRQSSRGRLGRSSNAKTARNSKV